MSDRSFPGSFIQRDSLAILCDEARELSKRLLQLEGSDKELLYLAQEHQERLLERLLHYQEVLTRNGISLPYVEAASPNDLVRLVPSTDENAH